MHTDHLNTPRVITDSNGNPVWRWDSAPFGETLPDENPQKTGSTSNFVFNLRFPGQYFDRETNLHYNYFRDYDPQTGRYIQSDPIGLDGGMNTFGYVSGNPISKSDPSGLLEQCRTGLDFLGGADIGAFHHEYLCWPEANGKRVCRGFGRDPDSSIVDAVFGRVKGKILKDGENVSHSNEKCEPDDKNKCRDQCAKRHFDNLDKGTSPEYGLIFAGSCQIAKQNIYQSCVKECGGKQ